MFMPRLVYRHNWQHDPKALDAYVDLDFAGCKETRRSTCGGCTIREAELYGIAMGAAQSLDTLSFKRYGLACRHQVRSDATAAIGICRRTGLGKIRHLDCTDLWIQEAIRSKKFTINKADGILNPADVLTKYVDKQGLEVAMKHLGMPRLEGRLTCSPAATGISQHL